MEEWEDEERFTTDYTNRCGNCHGHLDENDKYCKSCGTARGEGKFEPYQNISLCVYGPPIKMKYQCDNCRKKWITVGLGGLNKSKFCPECGTDKVSILREKLFDFSSDSFLINEVTDDYDEGDVLFTEEEVLKILSLRPKTNNGSYRSYKMLCRRLIKNGFYECEKAEKEEKMTEKEAERSGLAKQIIKLKGENPFEIYETKKIQCPSCKSKLLAAIGWYGEDDNGNEDSIITKYMKVTGKELYYNSGYTCHYEDSDNYHCLQCGCKFK